ncbi:MAG: OmpA family protein [Rhodocyclales bacterium]|nr:OmpA family protein [Rhodocyclales bacterium]
MRIHLPVALILLASAIPAVADMETPAASVPGATAPAEDGPGSASDDSPSYRLPQSHGRSIYFLPGSASLDESAVASVAAAAARLQADPGLRLTVVGLADDQGDAGQGDELRAERAAAVVTALLELGIPSERMSPTVSRDEDAHQCISEYCRQIYRRAALIFSRSASR